MLKQEEVRMTDLSLEDRQKLAEKALKAIKVDRRKSRKKGRSVRRP